MKYNKANKIFFGVIIFMFISFVGEAQIFEQGSKFVNLGFGVGAGYSGSGLTTSLPPISASFESGITDKIGVGGIIGYSSFSQSVAIPFLGSYNGKYSYLLIGARGQYHFDMNVDKLDFYGGVMLGYNIVSVSGFESLPGYTASSSSGLAIGLYLGGRYMFTEKIGGFAELGYSIAILNLGVTAKF